jgi:hypothetical protein
MTERKIRQDLTEEQKAEALRIGRIEAKSETAKREKTVPAHVHCKVFIGMSETGDWVVGLSETEVLYHLCDRGSHQARIVKVTVKMAPPVMAEAEVTVPDDAGQIVEATATHGS